MGARGKPLAEGDWQLDAGRSEVGFEVRHLGLSRVRGRFTRFAGTVRMDSGRLTAAGTVEVASVDTGDERRDHYLRTSDEFFDPAGHPQMRFAAGPASVPSGRAFQLRGELTIRGTTRPLDLEVEVERSQARDGSVVLRGEGALARGDYSLRFPAVAGYGDALVGETVRIRIRAVLLPGGS